MAMKYTNPGHQTNMQTQGYISYLFILQFCFSWESEDYCSQPSSMWLRWRPQGTPASSFQPSPGQRGLRMQARKVGGRARTLPPFILTFLIHGDISVNNRAPVAHRCMTATLCSNVPFICSISIFRTMILCQGWYKKRGPRSKGLYANERYKQRNKEK